MKYSELSNFTWEELSNLKWSDLSLSPTELLQKIVEEYNSEEIPSSVLMKLQKICYSLEKSCKANNIDIPPQITSINTKTKITKREFLTIVAEIVGIISFIASLHSQNKPTTQTINIYNYYENTYIIEEYPYEIKDIIDELKQTPNIHIEPIDDFIDVSPENNSQNTI